jgi:cbb3-type cytochrome oxidase subunit 3
MVEVLQKYRTVLIILVLAALIALTILLIALANRKTKKIPLGIEINPYNIETNITITCDQANFTLQENSWFINMYYPKEQERGLYPLEDHFIPGYFDMEAFTVFSRFAVSQLTILFTLFLISLSIRIFSIFNNAECAPIIFKKSTI